MIHHIKALTAMAVLALTAIPAAPTPASAAPAQPTANHATVSVRQDKAGAIPLTCYGSAHHAVFTLTGDGGNDFWPGPRGTWATTTTACADINIKPTVSRSFTVCFKTTGGCNGFHYAAAGQWTAIATNVLNGTKFYIQADHVGGTTAEVAY